MKFPALYQSPQQRDMIRAFRGLARTSLVEVDQFCATENLSARLYPAAATREARGKIATLEKPNGLHAHDGLVWVDGTSLFYKGIKIGDVSDTEKTFVSMGAYVYIWPDKMRFSTQEETPALEALEASITTTGQVAMTLSRMDGNDYAYTSSEDAPAEPESGQFWLDTSGDEPVLRVYSAATGLWGQVLQTCVKFGATGIGTGFAAGDGVTISGVNDEERNGDFVVQSAGEDFVCVPGMLAEPLTQTEPITIARAVPEMDFVCQHDNRLWGCSSKAHEIYASKLGDGKNWRVYAGLSTDSYAATVGSAGNFTACVAHAGHVIFFKEHIIHAMYGTQPSNFQLQDTPARGVQAGSEKSAIAVNETLFYLSPEDICAFSMALPYGVSEALGPERLEEAAAGVCGGVYYLSARRNGQWEMLTFDTERGIWYREDEMHATHFAQHERDLYFLTQAGEIWCVRGTAGEREKTMTWAAETGDIGIEQPDNSYVSCVQVRLGLPYGSHAEIYARYDEEVFWRHIADVQSGYESRETATPIWPRRCDRMRIKIRGSGGAVLYSVSKSLEKGSEIR